jgi:hypothetical protein
MMPGFFEIQASISVLVKGRQDQGDLGRRLILE